MIFGGVSYTAMKRQTLTYAHCLEVESSLFRWFHANWWWRVVVAEGGGW